MPRIDPGSIWLADLEPQRGTEPGKVRPVLVVQGEALLEAGHPSTLIVPLTTNLIDDAESLRIRVTAFGRLRKDSDLMIDQLRAIDNRRLTGRMLLLANRAAALWVALAAWLLSCRVASLPAMLHDLCVQTGFTATQSASKLISKGIAELQDWRGNAQQNARAHKEAARTPSRSGSGGPLRFDRTTASSAILAGLARSREVASRRLPQRAVLRDIMARLPRRRRVIPG